MKTIVQKFGPIYGEPVNGTVQGRPNGSVYVPLSNTVAISLEDSKRYFTYLTYGEKKILLLCTSDGTIIGNANDGFSAVAQSQDLSSNIQVQLFSDEELTTSAGTADLITGRFNVKANGVNTDVNEGLSDGDTVYLRVQLMNNGVPVATSNIIQCTMVVAE